MDDVYITAGRLARCPRLECITLFRSTMSKYKNSINFATVEKCRIHHAAVCCYAAVYLRYGNL